jgi:SnoaL-like domain
MTEMPISPPRAARSPAASLSDLTGRLPDDCSAFVKSAERLSNTYDAAGCARIYAPHARFETCTDGAIEQFLGAEQIARAWRVYMTVMERIGLTVQKRLLVAAGDLLVNDWEGATRSGSPARGFERWRFDTDGLVVEHYIGSFLDVTSAHKISTQLRTLLRSPRMAIAFLRASRRGSEVV